MNFKKTIKVRQKKNHKNESYDNELNHVNSDISNLIEKLNNLKKLRKTYENDSNTLQNRILLLKSEEKKIKVKTKNLSTSLEKLKKIKEKKINERERLKYNKKETQIKLIKKSIKNIFKINENKNSKNKKIFNGTLSKEKVNINKSQENILKISMNSKLEEEIGSSETNRRNTLLYSERIEKNRTQLGLESLSLNYEKMFKKLNKTQKIERTLPLNYCFNRTINFSGTMTPRNQIINNKKEIIIKRTKKPLIKNSSSPNLY